MLHEVSLGLTYLHSRGVLHRDVKVANVLLDDKLHAKISDFGIATRSTLIAPPGLPSEAGSARYLAPEMLFQHFNEKGDVYSFGLLMWEVGARSRSREVAMKR